jgi:hypothetical protein
MCFITLSSKGRAASDMVRSNKSGLTDMVFLLVLPFVVIQAFAASIFSDPWPFCHWEKRGEVQLMHK